MGIYYESDEVVADDPELQDFVNDVYVYGMRGKKASGRAGPSCSPRSCSPQHLTFPGPQWLVAFTLAPGCWG